MIPEPRKYVKEFNLCFVLILFLQGAKPLWHSLNDPHQSPDILQQVLFWTYFHIQTSDWENGSLEAVLYMYNILID